MDALAVRQIYPSQDGYFDQGSLTDAIFPAPWKMPKQWQNQATEACLVWRLFVTREAKKQGKKMQKGHDQGHESKMIYNYDS